MPSQMWPRRSGAISVTVVAVVCMVAGLVASPAAGSTESGRRLRVSAAFYPLEWMARRVGGPLVEVRSVTPPGGEPHDVELSARDVARVADADAVVFLGGFQPAVDDAVREAAPRRVFDAAAATHLDVPSEEDGAGPDPHFWLDPTKLAEVAEGFAVFLGGLDPTNAATYAANAAALRTRLTELDAALDRGLASCEHRDLVTSHAAFGYLARRYGLRQVGITGLTPEAEPSPRDLAHATDVVRDRDVRTVYFETLVPADIAKTVADETGARTAVLDPIEAITDDSRGRNYLQVMRANLRSLRKGQPCR